MRDWVLALLVEYILTEANEPSKEGTDETTNENSTSLSLGNVRNVKILQISNKPCVKSYVFSKTCNTVPVDKKTIPQAKPTQMESAMTIGSVVR